MKSPLKVLVVDIGGTSVKMLASGQTEPRRFPSGKDMTPARMMAGVMKLTRGWVYDVAPVGYPGPVLRNRPVADIVARLTPALRLDDVVFGGGNVNNLTRLPKGCRAGDNANALVGGFLLWKEKGAQS